MANVLDDDGPRLRECVHCGKESCSVVVGDGHPHSSLLGSHASFDEASSANLNPCARICCFLLGIPITRRTASTTWVLGTTHFRSELSIRRHESDARQEIPPSENCTSSSQKQPVCWSSAPCSHRKESIRLNRSRPDTTASATSRSYCEATPSYSRRLQVSVVYRSVDLPTTPKELSHRVLVFPSVPLICLEALNRWRRTKKVEAVERGKSPAPVRR